MGEGKKVGVVIFNHDYTQKGLAALQWATVLSMKPELHILYIARNDGSDEIKTVEIESLDGLYSIAASIVGKKEAAAGKKKAAAGKKKAAASTNWAHEFDNYIQNNVYAKKIGITYEGPNIKKMLEHAIEKYQLDTLVLEKEAVRTAYQLDTLVLEKEAVRTAPCAEGCMLLESECNVVFVKNPKPLMQPHDPKEKGKKVPTGN